MLQLRQDEMEAAESSLWEALRYARSSGNPRALADVNLSLGYFYQQRGKNDLAVTAFESSLDSAVSGEVLAAELDALIALARLDRLEGHVKGSEERLTHIVEVAQREGLEVAALSGRLHLGLCAWRQGDYVKARDAFEEVRQGARGNLFSHEFYACIGAAWSFAAESRWTDAEICLMQAEDLRFDVRLSDSEAEHLRLSLRQLAVDARRDDVVARIDKIDVVGTKTDSTQHTQ
jgi:tetratricopeptide (TPR) repeat protein